MKTSQVETSQQNFNKIISICYVRYYHYAVGYLRKYIHDDEICKEIVQESFLKILSKPITLDPDCIRTRNYIVSIAKNIAIDYLRRNRVEKARLKDKYYSETPYICNSEAQPPECSIFEAEINRIVKSSMQKFHVRQQHVFKEIILNGKGVAQVSSQESISRYMVKKYCDEVVSKLKEDLAEYRC